MERGRDSGREQLGTVEEDSVSRVAVQDMRSPKDEECLLTRFPKATAVRYAASVSSASSENVWWKTRRRRTRGQR